MLPLTTLPIGYYTIAQSELDRANKALTDLDARSVDVARLMTEKTALQNEVARLNLLLAVAPPPVPPHPPPVRAGLYVDGPTLRTRNGVVVQWRGIETLWGPTSAGNPTAAVAALRSFGANASGPIFQRAQSTAAHVKACLDAHRAQRMLVAVNADASGVDRAWLKQSDIVAVCNANADMVILEVEVELGSKASMTATQWRDTAIAFVLDLRAAGHVTPIRVGSPSGGRYTKYARQQGAAVLAADPLHNCLFTWQAYIDSDPSGSWQYQDDEGVSRGTAGALELADLIKATGLCWLVGLDGADDIGPTPYAELAARLHANGGHWQWWAMLVGDAYGNGLTDNALTGTPKAPFGAAVKALLTAQGVLAL